MIPDIETMTCSKCGCKYNHYSFNRESKIFQTMVAERVCHKCAFWNGIILEKPENLEIICGIAYRFLPYQEKRSPNKILGNDGKTMYILRKDGTTRKSNDTWTVGKVPDHFKSELPNTAYLIDRSIFGRINRRVSMSCEKKGCFDRYHCYFYDYRQEFSDGPYNIVPKNWIVGSEGCPTFVNVNKITGFEEYFDNKI